MSQESQIQENYPKTISITIETEGGKRYEGIIEPETLFVADVARAIRNGKDPIDAIALLADAGSSCLFRPYTANPISVQNRIGS